MTTIHTMQANYGEQEIKALLQKVRIFNKEIGQYELFAITGEFDYAVKLSNGKLLIKLEELQADEQDALTAGDLEKIAARFADVNHKERPTVPKQTPLPTKPAKDSSKWIAFVVITCSIVAIIITVFYFVEKSNTDSSYADNYETESYEEDYTEKAAEEPTYEEAEMTLEEKEQAEPTKFLDAGGTYRVMLLENSLKIKCEITNYAKVATFKDAVVRVSFFAESGTKLDEQDFTIYEVFPPGRTITSTLKVPDYSNVESIGWDVISAKVY